MKLPLAGVIRRPLLSRTQSKAAGFAALTAISVAASFVSGSDRAAEAVGAPTAVGTIKTTSLSDQIAAANAQLAQTAAAITDSKSALADVEARLPESLAQVVAAQAKAVAAGLVEQQATSAVVAANAQVQAVQDQIRTVRAQIDELQVQIGRLVRAAYITGGESQQLAVLLNAQDPQDFARQLEWLKRESRGNNASLDAMAAAKLELTDRLAELKVSDAAAEQSKIAASAAAQDAQGALAEVAAAQQAVTDLINKRATAVDQARASKAALAGVVSRLIDRQQHLIAERQAAEKARQDQLAAQREKQKQDGASTPTPGIPTSAAPAPSRPGSASPTRGTPTPSRPTSAAPTPGSPAPGPVVTVPNWPGQPAAALVALQYSLSKIGASYVSGGTGPTYDCIGLVWRAWNTAGSKWSHGPVQDASQSKWVQQISQGELAPGDLIMWRFGNGTDSRAGALDHIGMVVDPNAGTFVHAESPSTGVRLSNWKKESFYQHPAMFGRIVG